MPEVYSWGTPNGRKVHIMLEERGLPSRVIPVDIGAGNQFDPRFLAISPDKRVGRRQAKPRYIGCRENPFADIAVFPCLRS